jgi:hypothetical protein
MKHCFTTNQLIRYLYKETSASENVALLEQLSIDWDLREKYEELIPAHRLLSKVQFSPSYSSIRSLLEYSKSTALQEQW